VAKRHSTSAVQWIVAMSEYWGSENRHAYVEHQSMWLSQSQCILSNLQSKSVRSILLSWRNRYWYDISGHVASVVNAADAKHTDVHIPVRRKSCLLPLWGSSAPEHSVTRTLGRACVWKWPKTDTMAPEVPWHKPCDFFFGDMSKTGYSSHHCHLTSLT
jgi:hypothetical protein